MSKVRVKGVVTETITVRREVEIEFDDQGDFDFDIDIAIRDAAYETSAVPHDSEWKIVQSEGVQIDWKKVEDV